MYTVIHVYPDPDLALTVLKGGKPYSDDNEQFRWESRDHMGL